MLTVGPVAENCFVLRREGSGRGLIVDPGDEPDRILAKVEEMGTKIEAILITHCHFDHIGAGGAGRDRHRRAGLLPGDGATVARRHHVLRADPRNRPLRQL
jgi:glyoxylase-like metal-dependent hydrolase (beta-lactamase superfamily II)